LQAVDYCALCNLSDEWWHSAQMTNE